MKRINETEVPRELLTLCHKVRKLLKQKKYHKVKHLINKALFKYPHAPEPHNLFGLILEAQGDHLSAMKHFRAAYALDPAYIPSKYNLEYFGSFYTSGECAYEESDCLNKIKDDIHKNIIIELKSATF